MSSPGAKRSKPLNDTELIQEYFLKYHMYCKEAAPEEKDKEGIFESDDTRVRELKHSGDLDEERNKELKASLGKDLLVGVREADSFNYKPAENKEFLKNTIKSWSLSPEREKFYLESIKMKGSWAVVVIEATDVKQIAIPMSQQMATRRQEIAEHRAPTTAAPAPGAPKLKM